MIAHDKPPGSREQPDPKPPNLSLMAITKGEVRRKSVAPRERSTKGLLGLISQDKLRPALRATLRHADLETSSAQAARWYSLISPWRRC